LHDYKLSYAKIYFIRWYLHFVEWLNERAWRAIKSINSILMVMPCWLFNLNSLRIP
jgi:hypothetical protein